MNDESRGGVLYEVLRLKQDRQGYWINETIESRISIVFDNFEPWFHYNQYQYTRHITLIRKITQLLNPRMC
jgi:hypothetical protein